MAWTVLGVLGMVCLVVAAYVVAGVGAAFAAAGVLLIVAALDGRSDAPAAGDGS